MRARGSLSEKSICLHRLTSPPASSLAAHNVMSGNKGRDTTIELSLRRALWKSGVRGYRVNWRIGRRRIDICYPRRKVVIFVHGCFWHKCPSCRLATPKSHADYWSSKLAQNQLRDKLTRQDLEKNEWRVLEVWEHEIETNLQAIVARVIKTLRLREGLSAGGPQIQSHV